jgi:hypothetical protein
MQIDSMTKKTIAKEVDVDIYLILIVTAFVFGLAYHPYFFGDELGPHQLFYQKDSTFTSIYQGMNSYKPRLFFNLIETTLAQWRAPRLAHAALLAGCMAWINSLLYYIVRFQIKGDRLLAWILIGAVLSSRYGVMFYFDYLSGLIELLSSALLFTALLVVWLALRHGFNLGYLALSFIFGILCVFTHERYVVGLFVAGFVISFGEYVGPAARGRVVVAIYGFLFWFIPLSLFFVANASLGTMPISTGTAGQQVNFDFDTLLCALTYCYNIFLGGNYGHEWFWGHLNHLHPVGKFLGMATAACTIMFVISVAAFRAVLFQNRYVALVLLAIIFGFILIGSLPGAARQEARFMFPAGVVFVIFLVTILSATWARVAVGFIFLINLIYIISSSHDSIANIYASRAANSLASSLAAIRPFGKSAIVLGNDDDNWTFGGGGNRNFESRTGSTFSKLNLSDGVQIDPYVAGRPFDPDLYDFSLFFDGFGLHRTARYRIISVDTALILGGLYNADNLPVISTIGNNEKWEDWNWTFKPVVVDGAVELRPGVEGWRGMAASELHNRWLTYRIRMKEGPGVAMRLQVNWHAKLNNRFISTTIQVVTPTDKWQNYSMQLFAPAGADIGAIYANLHEGTVGLVELQSVDLH